jgi:hypothetical protein
VQQAKNGELMLTPVGNAADEVSSTGDLRVLPIDMSWGYLLALNAYNFANQLVLLTAGVVLLPSEAKRLWPDKAAVMLGVMLAVVSLQSLFVRS